MQCAKDLVGFGVMFIIVFIAFAQLGYIIFGTENEDFRTFKNAILTLLRTVLGDFDYLSIERANQLIGPIYFLTFIFFVFFVLLVRVPNKYLLKKFCFHKLTIFFW